MKYCSKCIFFGVCEIIKFDKEGVCRKNKAKSEDVDCSMYEILEEF